jgi:hypothetical protein
MDLRSGLRARLNTDVIAGHPGADHGKNCVDEMPPRQSQQNHRKKKPATVRTIADVAKIERAMHVLTTGESVTVERVYGGHAPHSSKSRPRTGDRDSQAGKSRTTSSGVSSACVHLGYDGQIVCEGLSVVPTS